MAGDATIQSALQTILRAMTEFADADVSLGDYRTLGRGSQPYAIVLAGPFRSSRSGDWSQVQFVWTHYIEVWERFMGDDYSAITTTRQAVIDEIAKYPTLNGTSGISGAIAESSGDPIYLWQRGQVRSSLPAFVGFRITVTTVEERLYAGSGEFA